MSLILVGNRKAFTLIELLVVVAIIALLIAILIPSLAKARERARLVRCGANLRQWGIAAHTYASDNNGQLPAKGGDGVLSEAGASTFQAVAGNINDLSLWFNALPSMFGGQEQGYGALAQADRDPTTLKFRGKIPHGGMNSIFICPSADRALGVFGNTQQPGSPSDTMFEGNACYHDAPYFDVYFETPTGPQGFPFLICYQWNSKIVTDPPSQSSGRQIDTLNNDAQCLRLSTASEAADLVLMSEKRIRCDEVPVNDPENPSMQYDSGTLNFHYYPLCQPKGAWQRFTTRHNDGGNILFIDGHVEFSTYRDVVTPRLPPSGGNLSAADWNWPGKRVWNPLYPAN